MTHRPMTHWTKSWMTGGLLGLAGLGLWPQEAQATPETASVDSDPTLGATLAEDPHPVVTPEPSAQPTEPQIDNLATLQPTWTPSVDGIAIGVADETLVDGATTATHQPAVAITADLEASIVLGSAAEGSAAEGSAAEGSAAEPPSMAPAPPIEQPAVVLPVTAPAQVQPNARDLTTAVSPASAPAPARPNAAAAPRAGEHSQRPAAADVATLRARSAAITALLQDIRATAGLEAVDSTASPSIASASSRPVPQAALARGPQLPPLPERSAPQAAAVLGSTTTAKSTKLALTHVRPISSPEVSQPYSRGPQLPSLPWRTTARQAASLRPSLAARPATSPFSAAVPSTPLTTAQADPVPATEALREDLRIDPLTTAADPASIYIPSSSAGIPSGFGAEWGDFFISATLAGADRLRPEADGSLYMGLGLGDAQSLVGLEIAYNLLSIRDFASNGSFDAKVHREFYSDDTLQVNAAVGVTSAFPYGSNAVGTESSLYGVVSSAYLLQPDHPTNTLTLNTTLGLGGGNFAGEGSDVGILAGVGLRVHPQFSINTAWSGVGLNVGASIVASPRSPISINLLYGDITNNTPAGSVAVISISYGINSNARF